MEPVFWSVGLGQLVIAWTRPNPNRVLRDLRLSSLNVDHISLRSMVQDLDGEFSRVERRNK